MSGVVAVMAGIGIAIFLAGALFGVIALVAASVKSEDKRTMNRADRSLALREEARGPMANGARRIAGVGVRIGNLDR